MQKKTHNYFIAPLFGILIFAIDLVSKQMVHHFIPLMNLASPYYPYGGIPIFQNFLGIEFSISHAINKGAAWGIFAEYQIYLVAMRLCLIAALIVYAFFLRKDTPFLFPFTLIIAGAAANVTDYFIYGHVVDMFHFVLWGYDYPVFNAADASIFIGVFLIAILSICERKGTETSEVDETLQ